MVHDPCYYLHNWNVFRQVSKAIYVDVASILLVLFPELSVCELFLDVWYELSWLLNWRFVRSGDRKAHRVYARLLLLVVNLSEANWWLNQAFFKLTVMDLSFSIDQVLN